jgi:hypothetical protein
MTSAQIQRLLVGASTSDAAFRNDTYIATLAALHDLAITASSRYEKSVQRGLPVARVYASEAETFRTVARALQRARDEIGYLLTNGASSETSERDQSAIPIDAGAGSGR